MIARKVYKYPSFFTADIRRPCSKILQVLPRLGSKGPPVATNLRLSAPEYLQRWYLKASNLSQGTKVLKWSSLSSHTREESLQNSKVFG